jgi:hypothetical protein
MNCGPMRPLLKPELMLDEQGIESTIVMFGGADTGATKRTPRADQTLADLSKVLR